MYFVSDRARKNFNEKSLCKLLDNAVDKRVELRNLILEI